MTETNQQRDDLIREFFNLPSSRLIFTKSQRAYADVREAIVTHSLPSGTPLDEALLHSRFPVGRTPLREALKRLNHEGLLAWPAHQAPIVRDVALHEMPHLYETRRILEPIIAGLAARRATKEDHAALLHYRDAMVEASSFGNIYESVERDFALHAAIARATQNRFLAEASDQLNLQSLRLWYRAQEAHGITRIHVTHAELVETIIQGAAEAAEQLAHDHIDSSLNRQRHLWGDT